MIKILFSQWDPVALLLLKPNCFSISQSSFKVNLNSDISGNVAITSRTSHPQDFSFFPEYKLVWLTHSGKTLKTKVGVFDWFALNYLPI